MFLKIIRGFGAYFVQKRENLELVYYGNKNLPPECPPKQAFSPTIQLYRLGGSNPGNDNYLTQFDKNIPPKNGYTTCHICGLSTYSSVDALRMFAKAPSSGKPKPFKYHELNLTKSDGKIIQSGNNISHYTWWRYENFDFSKVKVCTANPKAK